MRYIFTFLSLFLLCNNSITAQKLDSIIKILDLEIENKNIYHQNKVRRLDSIKNAIDFYQYKNNPKYKFAYDLKMFEEYKSFKYDSAFAYAKKLSDLAYSSQNLEQINISKIKIAFTFLSGGFFNESLDSLSTVDPDKLSDLNRVEFYYLKARTYYEMAEFANDGYLSVIYDSAGMKANQMAIKYSEEMPRTNLSMRGLVALRKRDVKNSIRLYELLFQKYGTSIPLHQFAIDATSLSYVYLLDRQIEKSNAMLAQAAIADLKMSIKETVAFRMLAERLFESANIKEAYKYINLSLDDAEFYEANYRKAQISKVMPIIEKEWRNMMSKQRRLLVRYSIIVTSLSLLIIVLAFIIYRQFNKLKHIQNKLEKSNIELRKTNSTLEETNKIKEEYIGHFFKVFSEYIEKIEKLKKSISRKLTTKNFHDIHDTIRNIDLKKERESLYTDFDKSFLKIFPNFIEQVNLLFKEEDKIVLERDGMLSPEIRIFALIRLGIRDNEKIAQVLNYSLNTIYTYKTKLKNKSIVSNEEFEEKLMEIRAV